MCVCVCLHVQCTGIEHEYSLALSKQSVVLLGPCCLRSVITAWKKLFLAPAIAGMPDTVLVNLLPLADMEWRDESRITVHTLTHTGTHNLTCSAVHGSMLIPTSGI